MIVVEVKIFGYLRSYCKHDCLKTFKFEVQKRSTVKDLLKSLGIPKEEHVILVINGVYTQKGYEVELKENDKIMAYPTISGG